MQPDWQGLADLNFSCFPVYAKSKLPAVNSWEPFQARHPSAEELAAWNQKQQINVGVVTGKISNIIVVDCDSKVAFDEVCRRGIPDTPRVRTARGWHIYLKWPGFPIANAAGLLPGVDIRADGGYVVGPGSTHSSGAQYHWERSPAEVPFAEIPMWLADLLKAKVARKGVRLPTPPVSDGTTRSAAYARTALANELEAVAKAQPGSRNAQLNKSAFALGGLVKAGLLSAEEVTSALHAAAMCNGSAQEDGDVATHRTIESGLKAAPARGVPSGEANAITVGNRTSCTTLNPDEPPRPLTRQAVEVEPFPLDALGPVLANAAEAIQCRVRAHISICASSVLAAVNYAVQGHADVELPNGQTRPVSLYFVSIAESGDRKSSTDHEALRPVYAREAILREHYDAVLPTYQNDKLAYERARDTALRANAKADRTVIRQALDRLGSPPTPPLKPSLLCSEPTYEGLFKLFALGQPSLGLFSTEGGGFLGGHGMSDESKLRTATGLSKLWDGAALDRVRAGDGDKILVGRRLACHLMLQPSIASLLLADETMADQGLLSRMLCVAPPSLAGTRFWSDAPAAAAEHLSTYRHALQSILEYPHPLVPGKPNELSPRVLMMSGEARSEWIRFQDEVEYHLGQGGKFETVRSRANKMPEMAARLAATLTLFDDIMAGHIDLEHMQRGISLARYFLSEGARLANGAAVDAELKTAGKVLTWLQTEWRENLVSLPDIYQLGPAIIRTQSAAKSVVSILEAHGWLHPVPEGGIVNGSRRRHVWKVAPTTIKSS
jgi:hypothetical protein